MPLLNLCNTLSTLNLLFNGLMHLEKVMIEWNLYFDKKWILEKPFFKDQDQG